MPANSGPDESLLFLVVGCLLAVSSHGRELINSHDLQIHNPIGLELSLTTSFNITSLETPSPNTATTRVRNSIYEFGREGEAQTFISTEESNDFTQIMKDF